MRSILLMELCLTEFMRKRHSDDYIEINQNLVNLSSALSGMQLSDKAAASLMDEDPAIAITYFNCNIVIKSPVSYLSILKQSDGVPPH